MTPLSKPAVNELAVVGATLDLWAEFLGQYFDGGNHVVGANTAVKFPKPELLFQQAPITQPSEKDADKRDTLAIALVWSDAGRKNLAWETYGGVRQQVATSRPVFNFWVRATGSNARAQGKLAADRLHGLLGNCAETRALAQKGIHRVRVTEPTIVESGDYVLYRVIATAQLRYAVKSQT